MTADRILVVFAGLCGAAGVALSAAAAHAGGGNVGTAASFLLMHAPAFLALGLAARGHALRLAGLALLLGVLIFCGDLLTRDYAGTRLFPMAAPAGGVLMIAGWLAVAASALALRRAGD
jgi:uncharacterized membrane protein YgdD (TMEM256/DUF423 family)